MNLFCFILGAFLAVIVTVRGEGQVTQRAHYLAIIISETTDHVLMSLPTVAIFDDEDRNRCFSLGSSISFLRDFRFEAPTPE